MNFPACFKLTDIKTKSQCLHFIWGMKIGRAVKRWTVHVITIRKDLIVWRESCCCSRNCLQKKLRENHSVGTEKKGGAGKILSNWWKARECYVNFCCCRNPDLDSLKKKLRENDSGDSEEWRRNSVKSWNPGLACNLCEVGFGRMAAIYLESHFVLKCLYVTKSDAKVRIFVKL